MHDRLATRRWVLVILLLGVLMAAPVTARAGTSTPARTVATSVAEPGQTANPARIAPVEFARTLVWWPYATGPYYGDPKLDGLHTDDVLITPVGTFRTGSPLPIPEELKARLNFPRGAKQYFLVQLRPTALDQPFAESLASMGATIVMPNPVNGLVLLLDRAAYELVSSSPLIQHIEPYHPAFKISPNIGTVPQLTPEAAGSSQCALDVRLFPGEPVQPVVDVLKRMGLTPTHVFAQPDSLVSIGLQADVSVVPSLAQIEAVLDIQETGPIILHAGRGSLFLQSETASINDFPYWKVGLQGDGQIAQVTDSGMSVNAGDHADTRTSGGWSAGNPSPHDNVLNDHRNVVAYFAASKYSGTGDLLGCDAPSNGTFTHGQITSALVNGNATRGKVDAPPAPSPTDNAAVNPNRTWVRDYGAGWYRDLDQNGVFGEANDAAFDGIGKGAKIVFVDAGTGCPDSSSAASLQPGVIQTTIQDTWTTYRANIHSYSFGTAAGGTGPTYNASASGTDAAVIAYPINVVYWSVGNEGPITNGNGSSAATGNVSNEATCKNCIGAGSSIGVGGTVASWTSEGPGPGKRHVVTVLAEGLDNSCRRDNTSESQTVAPSCADMGTFQGTSFSAPNLAGAATVIREYFAEGFYPDGTGGNPGNDADRVAAISGRLVRALMIAGTKPATGGKAFVSNYRFNNIWGWGQFFLNKALPLGSYSSETVEGLIVHDLPGNIDGNAGDDGVSNLSLPATIPTGTVSYTADFQVLDTKQDLQIALVWDDPVTTTGVINDDLDLEVNWCGADGTCGNGDDVTWYGDAFTEDINEDGTLQTTGTPPEKDLNGDGQVSGWVYSLSNADITAGGGIPNNYRNHKDNMEGVFIPTKKNVPDTNTDGTPDIRYLSYVNGSETGCKADPADPTGNTCMRTGKWQITVKRASGTTNGLYYAIAIAGPVSAGSAVRLDTNPVTCNGDQAIVVDETNDATDPNCTATSCPVNVIESRLRLEVYNGATLYDYEDGTGGSPAIVGNIMAVGTGGLKFQSKNRIPISSIMGSAIPNDGILQVQDGYTIKVLYNDNKGGVTAQRIGQATVDCQSAMDVFMIRQIGLDAPFLLAGGCDGDRYLDVGEAFGLQFQFFNQDPFELVDAVARLKAYNAGTTTPSPYIKVESSEKQIGILMSQTLQRTAFGVSVIGSPPPRTRTDFVVCISGAKSGQPTESCQTYQFLLQADDEKHRYITDCPSGCTLDYDRNSPPDEKWETVIKPNPTDPLDSLHQGLPEKSVVFEDMTPQNPGFAGPWDFDSSDKGFRSGRSANAKTSSGTQSITNWGEDSNWDGILQAANEDKNSNGILDENWGTGGGCGWMTKGTGTTGGVWHTGTIGTWTTTHKTQMCGGATGPRQNDNICEQYDVEAGTTGAAYWWEALRTPTIHPVHFGDASGDGYLWKSRIIDWSWNAQYDTGDWYAHSTWEFDLDLQDGTQNVLGDNYISKNFGGCVGVITGGQPDLYGGYFVFAPTCTLTAGCGSQGWGDETNGTKGGNRTGERGCYFNDLNRIADGSMTAANRALHTPLPADDDCDNDYTLGADGCPGACGVDDDNNGQIDDLGEICPCKTCVAGSPRAGLYCTSDVFCTAGGATVYTCQVDTNASGVPNKKYGDDTCGDGSTDENVSDKWGGTGVTLRQLRNLDLSIYNGVAAGGRGQGNILFNTLEDFYGPPGHDWAAEVGFIVQEASGNPVAKQSYGMAVDDMVVEWEETHPVAQSGSACDPANPNSGGLYSTLGACATVNLGTVYALGSGDRAIPVTVTDSTSGGNLGECQVGGTNGVYVTARSSAEPLGEKYCLLPSSPGSSEFVGTIKTTTRINKSNDGYVYTAFNAAQPPTVTVRYLDHQDGIAAHNWGLGPDNKPGIANFDDDGDGTVDNPGEQCSESTSLGKGRSPHLPGTPARWSDDTCGCPNNPVAASITIDFDTADLVISDVAIKDGGAAGLVGDQDGYADPNETIQLDLKVRNLSNFPIETLEVTVATNSSLVQCVTQDRVTIPRLEKHGDIGHGDEYDTATGTAGHFGFIAGAGNRTSTGQKFVSNWNVAFRGLAKAGADSIGADGQPLLIDLPISGASILQTFRITHNLNASAVTRAIDFLDDFESYTNDAMAVCTPVSGSSTCACAGAGKTCYIKRNTGDGPSDAEKKAELNSTHCQTNSPSNQYGNNTDTKDYCELGEGFSNTENHWHLQGPKPATGNTCERSQGCTDGGRSHGTGKKSLASGMYTSYGAPTDNNITLPFNRMYWVKTARTFQLGNGNTLTPGTDINGNKIPVACDTLPCVDQAPVLEMWDQISVYDWRLFGNGAPPEAWDSAMVYLCVDKNANGDCDTAEDGLRDNSENWEVLRAFYSPETSFRFNNFINCMYDPSDDGNSEYDFFPGETRVGPSSTCYPLAVDTCVGRTSPAQPTNPLWTSQTQWAGCWPETGKEGSEGELGTWGPTGIKWIKKLYSLKPWRGQNVLFRFHTSPGGLKGYDNCGQFCGDIDDGWFIDDLRVYGLAALTLGIDNTGQPGPPVCPGAVDTITARLAAIHYPRNDKDSNPLGAIACSDTNVAYCDFNNNNIADATSATGVLDAPGRPFVLEARESTVVKCLGGSLEFRFVDTNYGTVVRDWGTQTDTVVTPACDTTYQLDARCSSDTSPSPTISSAQVRLQGGFVCAGACAVQAGTAGFFATKTRFSWTGSGGPFDVARGDVSTMLGSAGNFSTATCLTDNTANTFVDDPTTPANGKGNYYLSRCNGLTYNDGTQTGSRDTTLTACP